MDNKKLYPKIAATLFTALIIVLLCIFLLPKLIGFFFPFVVGWIIALIANPLVRFMEKKIKIVRKHSSAIIIIAVLAAVIGILYGAGSFLIRELLQFLRDVPEIYTALGIKMNLFLERISAITAKLPYNNTSSFDDIVKRVGESISVYMANYKLPTFSDAGNFAKNIADGLFSAIIIILSSYFFIAERDKLVMAWRKAVPCFILDKVDMIVNNFKRAIGGYLRAQFKLMAIVFVILWIGFLLLQVDYAFLFAFLVAFIDLLPFFGTGAVLWPWAVYEFIIGRYGNAVFLLIIYILCQVIKQVLQPKMVGDSIGVSPLATLFFMFIGYKLGDLGGLIIGIPIGMVIVNFYRSGLFDNIIRSVKILLNDLFDYLRF